MKHIFQRITILLAACLFIASGCSDDKSDFEGVDCYFVSFSLTVDGVAYPAKISENNILLEVPYDVDLSKAEVNYQLNENASVLPDPASITNWSADQVFRVQSFNSNFNTFVYSLSRTNIVTPDDVTLLTQADVEAFAKKNINHIKGNLIIGEAVSSLSEEELITNLDNLSGLTHVDHNIVLKSSFGGDNIDGLSNLKTIGGFYIGSTTDAAHPRKKLTIQLPELTHIGNLVVHSDSVTNLSLPKVEEVADLYVKSNFLDKFTITALKKSYGNLTVRGENNSLNELLFPHLVSVSGNLTFDNLKKLAVVGIGALQSVGGNLEVKSLTSLELINFPLLTQVDGDFTLTGNLAITKIVAPELASVKYLKISNGSMYSLNLKDIILPKLKTVETDLALEYLGGEKVSLPMLEKIGGAFTLQSGSYLSAYELPQLTECTSIRLTGAGQLKSLDFSLVKQLEKIELYNCSALERVNLPKVVSGDVIISSSSGGDTFLDFGSLEKIGGALTISGYNKTQLEEKKIKEIGKLSFSGRNTTLESVGFTSLVTCGELSISNLPAATTLSLPKLTQAASFSIQDCPLLVQTRIPQLQKIEGRLHLQGARWQDTYLLQNLDNFSSLTSVGSVAIQYARFLTDFSGLKNALSGMSADSWKVSDCKYNPTWQDMLDGKYTKITK